MIWYFIITCRKILVLLGQLEAKQGFQNSSYIYTVSKVYLEYDWRCPVEMHKDLDISS